MDSQKKPYENDEKLSKTLSWALRHGLAIICKNAKSTFDESGFVDIDVLLNHYAFRNVKLKFLKVVKSRQKSQIER